MASEVFYYLTNYNLSTGAWSGRSFSAAGFTVSDGEPDFQFDLGDSLIFGGYNGQYQGTVTYLGSDFPVISNGTTLTIVGANIPQASWPTTASFTVTPQAFATALCFAPGTGIATPSGEVAVETLNVGDLVTTADGRAVAVKWIGRQTVSHRHAGPAMQPVRIRAGALGDNLPYADLVVTPDHGMVLDGLVINASALVNHDSIAFLPLRDLPESVTYYHVETDAHDVILACGAASETFVDAAARALFDNHADYLRLYGTDRILPEMPLPRITARRLLPDRIRRRLDGKETVHPPSRKSA